MQEIIIWFQHYIYWNCWMCSSNSFIKKSCGVDRKIHCLHHLNNPHKTCLELDRQWMRKLIAFPFSVHFLLNFRCLLCEQVSCPVQTHWEKWLNIPHGPFPSDKSISWHSISAHLCLSFMQHAWASRKCKFADRFTLSTSQYGTRGSPRSSWSAVCRSVRAAFRIPYLHWELVKLSRWQEKGIQTFCCWRCA